MTYNIEYPINKSTLLEDFKRTVSLVAAQAVDQNNGSLYDAVKVYERNAKEVDRYLSDSIRSFVARFSDVTRLEMGIDGFPTEIDFYLPDFNMVDFDNVGNMIADFILDKAVSLWFTRRIPDMAKFYAESAVGTLAEIAILLRTRKAPERS